MARKEVSLAQIHSVPEVMRASDMSASPGAAERDVNTDTEVSGLQRDRRIGSQESTPRKQIEVRDVTRTTRNENRTYEFCLD